MARLWTPTARFRVYAGGLTAVLCVVAVGCGGNVINRSELEEQVQTQLTAKVGQQAPEASCPDELKAEVGATTRCSMEFPEGTLGITVEVTEVGDDKATFDIRADDKIQPKGS